jgi:DNA-binding MarR family transcriptional regulator
MSDYVTGLVADWARERPELDTSSMEVVGRLLRVGQILQHRLDAVAARYGLSHKGDLDVLTALRRMGPPYEQTPSRLAKGVQLTTGGMTNRLDRLEAANLVARRPDPSDRRGVLVYLTDDGQRVVDNALEAIVAEQEALIGTLSARERATIAGMLGQLLTSLGDRGEERVGAVG